MPMPKNTSVLLIIFLLCLVKSSLAQTQEPRLGIAIKPIIPSGLFDNQELVETQGKVQFSIEPKLGYSAGVVLRQDLPSLLSFETGIYYVRRIYDLAISDNLNNSTRNKFRFVNYEVPITGLIYIRLSENMYLNNTFGISLDFFPNSIFTENEFYQQRAERNYWVLPGLIADVGAEYRTKKSGNFYIGGAYHRMLLPMANTIIAYKNGTIDETITTPLSGHYFAFNFRYFFPTQRTAPVDFF
ncbi:MAG: outer membrane beta-barrel protein [Bacteroidia bacterium]